MSRYLSAVLVGPVTSTVRQLSTDVPVGRADGDRRDSVVNLDNSQLVSRTRLVGRVRRETMRRLCGALAIAVACDRGRRSRGRLPKGARLPTVLRGG